MPNGQKHHFPICLHKKHLIDTGDVFVCNTVTNPHGQNSQYLHGVFQKFWPLLLYSGYHSRNPWVPQNPGWKPLHYGLKINRPGTDSGRLKVQFLRLFALGDENLMSNKAVDDQRTCHAGVPHRTGHSGLEPVSVDTTQKGQRCQQKQECARQAVHSPQLTNVDKFADELRKEQVQSGTQLHEDVADCCRSNHRVWRRQVRLSRLLLREVDRQEPYTRTDIFTNLCKYYALACSRQTKQGWHYAKLSYHHLEALTNSSIWMLKHLPWPAKRYYGQTEIIVTYMHTQKLQIGQTNTVTLKSVTYDKHRCEEWARFNDPLDT